MSPWSRPVRLGAVAAVLAVLCTAPVAAATPPEDPGPPPPGTASNRPLPEPGVPDVDLTPLPLPSGFPDAVPGAPWVVSLGDSFISGEAGRWAGNTDDDSSLTDALGPTAYFDSPLRDRELIPLCHRSTSAMIHIGEDAAGAPVNSLNLACSGAQTRTMLPSGAFKPGLDFYDGGPGRQGQALMLQQVATTNDVRMVVVSIGGNDFSFGPIVQACVEDFLLYDSYCSSSSTVLGYINAPTVDRVTTAIAMALDNVRTAMRNAGRADGSWTLVFNLNPDTLATGGDFRYGQTDTRQSTGGCGFWDTDATWASGTLVGTIRSAQQAAVARAGVEPSVLLDLGRLVDNRELCTNGTQLVGASGGAVSWQAAGAVDVSEWANQVHTDTVDGPYFQQESMHPNYWAQLAARSCVRQVYAEGTPTGGTCLRSGTGLTARGEPVMSLTGTGARP